MATKKRTPSSTPESAPSSVPAAPGNKPARALVDLPQLGVLAGRYFEASEEAMAALVAAGAADIHPDAVAYALSMETPR